MNFQHKKTAIRILILSLIIGVVIFTFLTVRWRERDHFTQGFMSSSKLAHAKGISFVEYHGDKKVYAVSIDSFSVERARIGPFAIGPLRVAHLDKVNIDLYLDQAESRLVKEKGAESWEKNFENPISGIKKNLPPQLKKIRGIELKDISANIWENEQKIFRISSDTATVDRKTGDIVFAGHANMDAGENGRLISHRIRWDRKTRLFRVKDSYILTKGKETKQGNEIETDYMFTRVNYRPAEK
jgi:hypothetical protein